MRCKEADESAECWLVEDGVFGSSFCDDWLIDPEPPCKCVDLIGSLADGNLLNTNVRGKQPVPVKNILEWKSFCYWQLTISGL